MISRRSILLWALGALSFQLATKNAVAARQPDNSWELGPMTVEQAWVRIATGKNELASIYMTIHNRSLVDDYLLAVETDQATRSEIHETIVLSGSAMSQAIPGGLDMPSHGEVVMRPGGLHIMLTNVSKSVKLGGLLPVRMFFREAGMIELSIPVLAEATPDPIEKHTAHTP